MAKKKNEWIIDEWDDSLDAGKKPEKSDPFSVDPLNMHPADDWDDDLLIPADRRQLSKKPSGSRSKKIIISLASAIVLIAIVTGVILTYKPPLTPTDLPVTIHSVKPEEPVTEPPTEKPTEKPTKAPTKAPTKEPTKPPTKAPTDTPSPEPAKSSLLENPWYGPEYRYYYQFLTEHEKEVFEKVYDGVKNHSYEIFVSYTSDAEWERIFNVLVYDCPEFFHLGNYYQYSFSGFSAGSVFSPEYRLDQATYERKCESIHSTINKLRASFSPSNDDFDKELIIYRYLIDHCDYLAAGDDSTASADACLFEGKAQCSGYAKALDLALRSVGIQSLFVQGERADHAWNVVNINGDWYQCDVTWDDTGTDGIRTAYEPGEDEFNGWMNLPDRLSNYAESHQYDEDPGFPVPHCTSIDESYAKRRAIYIGPGDSNLAATISRYLQEARQKGKRHVLMMLDDASYINNWDSIWNQLGSVYGTYNWSVYPPNESHRCLYAVDTQ